MAELTYLANTDAANASNPFYALAKQYFAANGSTVVDAPPEGQTVEGILADLKAKGAVQETINIVCQSTGFGALGMAMTLVEQSAGKGITIGDDVLNALTNKTLVPPGSDVVSDRTRVVLYGADLGRSTNFLMLLSGLFGNPGELLAPRRMCVFTLDGAAVQYRQAQSWTLVSKAPLLPPGTDAPAEGWPAYRSQFVNDANQKFGPVALLAEAGGDAQLSTILTAAASAATTASAATFFVESVIQISATATETARQVVDGLKPMSNGDPVTAVPQSAAQVDDSTVVTTITGADAYPTSDAQTSFSLGVVSLAQLVEEDVPIAEGPAYARVTSSQGLAPSLGPGGAGGSGDPGDALQAALLAIGLTQAQVDELLAGVPQEEATDAVSADSPDAEPSPTDPDCPMPQAGDV